MRLKSLTNLTTCIIPKNLSPNLYFLGILGIKDNTYDHTETRERPKFDHKDC